MVSVIGVLYFVILCGLSFFHRPLLRVIAVLPPGALVFVTGWAKLISKKKNAALDADDVLRQTVWDIAEELQLDHDMVMKRVREFFHAKNCYIPDRWRPIPDELNFESTAPESKKWKQALVSTGLIKRSGPRDGRQSA
jgi:hypothetical protein